MVLSGDYLFIGLIVLSGLLTYIALRANIVLFRMAASISWLSLGLLLLLGGLGTSMSDAWVQALGFVFLIMTIAPLLLQMRSEVRREIVGKKPGTPTISWTEWTTSPDKRRLSVSERSERIQSDYRQKLREVARRAERARRGY